MSEPITFSLIKAQKYLTKLKTHLKNSSGKNTGKFYRNNDSTGFNPKTIINLSQITLLTTVSTEATTVFEQLATTAEQELTTRINIMSDLNKLKNLVYTTNATTGISKILSEMELQGEQRSIYENIKKSYTSESSYDKTQIPSLMDRFAKSTIETNDAVKSANIKVYDIKELDKKIIQYTRDIETLENSRDKLNANTQLTFTFSPESLSILGL